MNAKTVALGLAGIGACWLAYEIHQKNAIDCDRLALDRKKARQEFWPRMLEAAGKATGSVIGGAMQAA